MNKRKLRYVFTCDLKDDPSLVSEYKRYHEKIWPEITKSIRDKGIRHMEIYQVGDRMFMTIEVDDTFSFSRGDKMDKTNPKVEEWEALMSRFQKPPPMAGPGEKWVLMEKIFDLNENG